MGLKKNLLGAVMVLLSSVVAHAGGEVGIKCKEFDLKSQSWGQEELWVNLGGGPRGTDLTVWKNPEKVQKFYSTYEVEKSPHYRWGYEVQYNLKTLPSSLDDTKMEIEISVRQFGPTFREDGSYGYQFDGSTALKTNEVGSDGSAKQVYFRCKLTNEGLLL